MQKRLVGSAVQGSVAADEWLELEDMARVELTSEDPDHPIETALVQQGGSGWRAGEPGRQRIRLVFHQPQRLRRIKLRFDESHNERTQEFALRWSADGGRSFQDLVRQQYTFSPAGATTEVEDLNVDLASVTALELTIIPDGGRGEAHASLTEWRLA